MYAVARFMFLCKFAQLRNGVNFAKNHFDKTISRNQLSFNLKKRLGFRRKDFITRYTTDRNSLQTLKSRQDFANRIKKEYGEEF